MKILYIYMVEKNLGEGIKLGECPYCHSTDYSRNDQNWDDNFCSVHCTCNKCEKDFKEYFSIDEIGFDTKEETGIVLNNALFQCDKDMILKWAEKELKIPKGVFLNAEHYDSHRIPLNRIITIMKGGLVRGD